MLPVQVEKLDELKKIGMTKIAVAIGVFDGIHLGHRKIIRELIKMSKELSATPVLVTFFPHPRKILYPDRPLRFLRSPAKKAKILGRLGIEAIVTIPFTLEFANLSPNEFIEKFMHPHNVRLAGICVGKKWKFGAKAEGDEKTLHDFADRYRFKFKSVEEVYWNNKRVSSTAIRNALAKGDFESAEHMLNRRYIISGHVLNYSNPGNGNTIKVQIDFGVLPPAGAYTVYLNNNRKTKISAKVISQSKLLIDTDGLSLNAGEIDFEFSA